MLRDMKTLLPQCKYLYEQNTYIEYSTNDTVTLRIRGPIEKSEHLIHRTGFATNIVAPRKKFQRPYRVIYICI